MPKRIKFEPHKGDEVSAVNAQVLIRDEMQSRFVQMQNRLAGLKTENDEVSANSQRERERQGGIAVVDLQNHRSNGTISDGIHQHEEFRCVRSVQRPESSSEHVETNTHRNRRLLR